MRAKIGVVFLLGIVFGILAGPTAALAVGKDSGTGPTFLDLQMDPTARGTRVDGVITLYYEPTAAQGYMNKKVFVPYCPLGDTRTRMTWFMRFNHNFVNYGFSGNSEPFCFVSDMTSQANAIRDFVNTIVVPTLFYGSTVNGWVFKEYRNLVQNQGIIPTIPCCRDNLGGGFNGAMEFVTSDISLAVDAK